VADFAVARRLAATAMLERLHDSEGGMMFAATLVALGTFCLARAVIRYARGRRERGATGRNLEWVRALRASLVGGALVGGGFGIFSESAVLVGLALIIGGEELLETSVVVAALKDEKRRSETPT
jgi:hypothetical protein